MLPNALTDLDVDLGSLQNQCRSLATMDSDSEAFSSEFLQIFRPLSAHQAKISPSPKFVIASARCVCEISLSVNVMLSYLPRASDNYTWESRIKSLLQLISPICWLFTPPDFCPAGFLGFGYWLKCHTHTCTGNEPISRGSVQSTAHHVKSSSVPQSYNWPWWFCNLFYLVFGCSYFLGTGPVFKKDCTRCVLRTHCLEPRMVPILILQGSAALLEPLRLLDDLCIHHWYLSKLNTFDYYLDL